MMLIQKLTTNQTSSLILNQLHSFLAILLVSVSTIDSLKHLYPREMIINHSYFHRFILLVFAFSSLIEAGLFQRQPKAQGGVTHYESLPSSNAALRRVFEENGIQPSNSNPVKVVSSPMGSKSRVEPTKIIVNDHYGSDVIRLGPGATVTGRERHYTTPDGTVQVWDAYTRNLIRSYRQDGQVRTHMDPNGLVTKITYREELPDGRGFQIHESKVMQNGEMSDFKPLYREQGGVRHYHKDKKPTSLAAAAGGALLLTALASGVAAGIDSIGDSDSDSSSSRTRNSE